MLSTPSILYQHVIPLPPCIFLAWFGLDKRHSRNGEKSCRPCSEKTVRSSAYVQTRYAHDTRMWSNCVLSFWEGEGRGGKGSVSHGESPSLLVSAGINHPPPREKSPPIHASAHARVAILVISYHYHCCCSCAQLHP